jgi:hypothetical protein
MYKQLTIRHFALETVSVVLKQSHNHEKRNFEKSEINYLQRFSTVNS